METLASEKLLLEMKLANEKKESVNEKENLSDQLRHAQDGFRRAQSMYEVRYPNLRSRV